MSEKSVRFVLAAVGFVVTFVIARVSERLEAWDSGLYWTAGLPVMALACALAGYYCPPRTWSYGFSVIAGSMAAIVGLAGVGNLWPIGLFFATLLALACGAAAKLGNHLSRRLIR